MSNVLDNVAIDSAIGDAASDEQEARSRGPRKPTTELQAMAKIEAQLIALPTDVADRVVRYFGARFTIPATGALTPGPFDQELED